MEAIYHVLTVRLDLIEPAENSIVESATSAESLLAAWWQKSIRLVNLCPLEDAIQHSLQKWLVSQDEQLVQEMKKDLASVAQSALLSRLSFAVKELAPLSLCEYQPGGILFRQTISAASKQIFW